MTSSEKKKKIVTIATITKKKRETTNLSLSLCISLGCHNKISIAQTRWLNNRFLIILKAESQRLKCWQARFHSEASSLGL